MAGPTPSWGTVPVFGTWLLLDGTPVAGKVRFTLPQRITNAPGDVIFPRNGVLEFALGAETGSINFDCPVLDDPDNFPDDASVQILVEEIFVNAVNASYYIRPVAAMSGNTPPGLDLRTVVVVSDSPAAPPPSLIRGVPGGVAALDTSGNVLDGAGHPVVGGVASVNGHAGTVVLAASDVGADATGAAAAAQAAAAIYTNGQVAGEASARATAITAAINGLLNGAPGALDTLKELADAFGDDPSFAATVTTALTLKAPLASPAFTGDCTINGVDAAPRAGARPVGQGEQLFNVIDYSAVGDAQSSTAGAISASSHTLIGTGFASGDVGKVISVVGAGASGATLSTTISGFTSSTSVTLTAAASTTVSGASVTWGTDDTAAINAVIAAAPAGSRIQLGLGKTHLTSGLLVSGKTGLIFDGVGAKILLKATGARHGIELAGTCTNVHVVNQNIVANGVVGDAHAGVIIHDSISNVITACSVAGCQILKPTVGVSVELSASGGTVNGWTVADNFIDTPTGTTAGNGYGIHISAGVQSTPTGARITGNKIRNAQRHAIYSAHGIGTVIDGNSVWGHRTGVNSGTVTAAINVLRSSQVTVVGNTCQFGWDGAFNFASDTGAADGLTCEGNTFTDPMDAVSVVNIGDPTPTPTTPTRNVFFGPNKVSTTNTGALVTIFCGVNVYVHGSTLNYNNATGGSAVVLYGEGDSASNTFNNNIVISNNAITMEGGGTNIAFRLAGIEATTATVDFRNNPLSGVTTTFAAAVNPTNPNLLFNGHKTDGLTFAATVGLREVPLAPVLFVPNAPIAPPTTTSGGMYLWSQGGSLRGHVTNGTKTIVGNVTSVSADYSVLVTDEVILASGGAGGITCTLPASTRGMQWTILKGDNTAGAITIATTSSQLINGASTFVLPKQYDAITLRADGTGYIALGITVSKINGVALSSLATGLLKNTTGTGVPSIAVAADVPVAAVGGTGPLDATKVAPGIIPTYLAFLTTLAATAWPTANTAIFQRFTVPVAGTYRYANFHIDVSSGNIQYGIVQLSGTGNTSYTRVATSGVIAAPTAGDQHGDLGSTALAAGEYAFFLWVDNTTLTTRYGSNSGVSCGQCSGAVAGLTVTGVPSSGSVTWNSGTFLGGVTIGRDV